MSENIVLENKIVGDIAGKFFVPSYQRGYRWGVGEVSRLLEDIYKVKEDETYYLQPIVVKKMADGKIELIDGQQRLTTLFILLQYIQKEYKPKLKLQYSLEYKTRKNSEEFLKNIDESQANDNIDYFCTWYNNECYLIPVSECGRTEKNLRLVPTKNGQVKGISFAKDYIAKEVLNR